MLELDREGEGRAGDVMRELAAGDSVRGEVMVAMCIGDHPTFMLSRTYMIQTGFINREMLPGDSVERRPNGPHGSFSGLGMKLCFDSILLIMSCSFLSPAINTSVKLQ